MTKYIAVTLDGQFLDNKGVGYVSRRAARNAAVRRGTVAVETRRLDEELPDLNDARGWDAARTRAGHPSY